MGHRTLEKRKVATKRKRGGQPGNKNATDPPGNQNAVKHGFFVEHKVNGKYIIPHTHKGYWHYEKGTRELSQKEEKMLDRILKTWENRNR